MVVIDQNKMKCWQGILFRPNIYDKEKYKNKNYKILKRQPTVI